jgi:hypothetical protein
MMCKPCSANTKVVRCGVSGSGMRGRPLFVTYPSSLYWVGRILFSSASCQDASL